MRYALCQPKGRRVLGFKSRHQVGAQGGVTWGPHRLPPACCPGLNCSRRTGSLAMKAWLARRANWRRL